MLQYSTHAGEITVISGIFVPSDKGLTSGLYEIAATVEVGPGNNPCAQHVFGRGYIQEFLLQVYQA